VEQLWCEGVTQSGARPLEEAELAAARAARSRARLGAALAAAGACVWVAGSFALEIGPGIVTGIVLGIPAGILLVRDRLRAASALSADLKAGEALRFGELEVLPRSHLSLPDLRRVFVGIAAVPDPGEDGMRRALNESELDELEEYIRRRKGAGILAAAGLAFLSMGIMLNTAAMRGNAQIGVFLVSTLPLAYAAVVVIRRIRMLWFSRNLWAGYVTRSGGLERLRTGRIWSEDGRPPRWRLRRAR
jgi:hypothetical protein